MKKVSLCVIFCVIVIFITGCKNNPFNSARNDFKPLYIEITKGTLVVGKEKDKETSDISKILNEEGRAEKILELKDIVDIMEENAESEKQKRILVDYRDYYEALVEIQSYTTPDSECSEDEAFQRLACKILVTMGMREAMNLSHNKY